MFNLGIWQGLFGITFILFIILGILYQIVQSCYIFVDRLLLIFFLIFFSVFLLCSGVVNIGDSYSESYYSDLHDIRYGEIKNIESVFVDSVEENSDSHSRNRNDEDNNKILKVLLTNKADRLQIKNYPFNPENSEKNISNGCAVLQNSNKKVIEKVTATAIKTIDYHCPLIKDSTKEETITYYIVYYPANELKF